MNARRLAKVSAVFCAFGALAATSAFADGKSDVKAPAAKAPVVKSAPTAFFETLPVGKLDIPTHVTMPDSIPKGESVDGVYLDVPEYVKANPANQRYVQVYASKEDMQSINAGTGNKSEECFMAASPPMTANEELRWNGALATQTTVQPVARSYSYGPNGSVPDDLQYVTPLRVDRVVASDANGIKLESRVVLIDTKTMGARLVETETTDFKLIEELPGKVKVYGVKGDKEATFLVRRERLPDERTPFGPMFAQQGVTTTSSTSEGCHLTFTLPVKQAAATTAVVQLEALLELKPMNADDDAQPSQMANMQGEMAATPTPGQHEARIRPMQIGFSATWLSEDKAPVVSISHGWTGRERTQPM